MMKNILVFIAPDKQFDDETKILVKVQIDNLLDLGWSKSNIILLTNFPYQYRNINAMIGPDDLYSSFNMTLAKINGILFLFDQGLIMNEIYFCHDFDHYQLVKITQSEIKQRLVNTDIGLADYGRIPRWNLSCIFFNSKAKDIFQALVDYVNHHQMHNEEDALDLLTENDQVIKNRVKKLNITYNLKWFNIRSTYPTADKPIKGVHFHPTPDMIDFFMYGKNKINTVLLPERLVKIFIKHGIK